MRNNRIIDWDRVRDAARGAVEGYTGADDERVRAARADGIIDGANVALNAYRGQAGSADAANKGLLVVLGLAVVAGAVMMARK